MPTFDSKGFDLGQYGFDMAVGISKKIPPEIAEIKMAHIQREWTTSPQGEVGFYKNATEIELQPCRN